MDSTIAPAPLRPARRLRWPSRTVLILLGWAAFMIGLQALIISGLNPDWEQYRMVDLDIYLTAIRYVFDGRYLYGFEPTFTYPPFAFVLMAPLGLLKMGLLAPALQILKVFLLELLAWRYLTGRVRTERRALVLAVVAGLVGAVFVDPLGQDLSHGQVNVFLLALVAFDLLRGPDARWRGIGVGIAAGIKLVPGLFIVHLLVTRQFRAAAVAAGAAAATVAIGFAVMPRASWDYWTSVLWDNTRVWTVPEVVLNQTVHGVVIRALGHESRPTWLLISVVVAAAGLVTAAALHRRDAHLAALSAVGITAAVVTPQGWIHHHVWLGPALLIVAVACTGSWLRWTGFFLLFTIANSRWYFLLSGDPWRVDALHLSTAQQLSAANLIIAELILLALAWRWIRRTPAPAPAPVHSVTAEPVSAGEPARR